MITRDDVVLAISNSGETDELADDPAGAQAPRRAADRDDRQSAIRRWRATPTCTSTSASRPRPARSISRRPRAPPRRWRWAMRSRSRCSRRAASPRRISRARTRAARSAAGCCCTSRTSCARGDDLPAVGPRRRSSDGLLEMSRKGLGMTAIVDATRTCSASSPTATCAARSTAQVDVHATTMREVMTARPQGRSRPQRARGRGRAPDGEAHDHRAAGRRRCTAALVGALNVHDLLRAGVM